MLVNHSNPVICASRALLEQHNSPEDINQFGFTSTAATSRGSNVENSQAIPVCNCELEVIIRINSVISHLNLKFGFSSKLDPQIGKNRRISDVG